MYYPRVSSGKLDFLLESATSDWLKRLIQLSSVSAKSPKTMSNCSCKFGGCHRCESRCKRCGCECDGPSIASNMNRKQGGQKGSKRKKPSVLNRHRVHREHEHDTKAKTAVDYIAGVLLYDNLGYIPSPSRNSRIIQTR